MEKLVYNKAFESWEKIREDKSPKPFERQVELFKKMLDVFQIGDSFYLIFNVTEAKIEFCDSRVSDVLGYNLKEITLEHILAIIHPDDLPVFMNYEAEVAEFFSKLPPEKVQKYKARYDYRVLTKRGAYKRLMHQAIPLQIDSEGAVLQTLVVYSDVGYLKQNKSMTLSILGMDGEPSFLQMKSTCSAPKLINPISPREMEVLTLIAMGKSSKEIAHEMHLAEHTVNNHRKNMLRKAGVSSSTGLLSKAIENTWI